jgi:hypothetical protein
MVGNRCGSCEFHRSLRQPYIKDMKAEMTLRVKNIYVKPYNIGSNVGVLMLEDGRREIFPGITVH